MPGLFLARAGIGASSRYNGPMQITLNGTPRDCSPATTVAQLLDEAGYGQRRVAVEVNHEIVPRSLHTSHALAAGDRVEIVHAIGGG
ncbi:ThiS family 23 protein [Dyella terrae]|nr:ThiS family 23 protein [Dyella terrae]